MIKKIARYALYCFITLSLFLVYYVSNVVANTPPIDAKNVYGMIAQGSVILDDKGNPVDSVYADGANRQNISYKDMPKDLVNAVVSIEDKTFWTHGGFNYWRMLGAIKNSITSSSSIKGTSTITQQLARNAFLAETKSVRSLNRKVAEAYYTFQLEGALSKEEIMEAYLNTIYFGNNAYGVQAAAQTYFYKDAKDLDLAECVALASMPQAPSTYSLIKSMGTDAQNITIDKKDILKTTQNNIYYYDDQSSKERRELTLKLMKEQGYINDKQYNEALKEDLRSHINMTASDLAGNSYLSDYIVENVKKDLMEKYNYTREEATEYIFTGGLKIYSSINSQAQKAINDEFSKNSLFASSYAPTNGSGDIVDTTGKVALRKHSNYFDKNGTFTLTPSEYKEDSENITLLKGKRLNFYSTKVNGKTDYSIEFKPLYYRENGILFTIQGGFILIPQKYKSMDSDGNIKISKEFFNDKKIKKTTPNFLKKDGNNYIIPENCYSLKDSVQQPQAAMVIMDYKTGEIKAMSGGRNTVGRNLYNRAIKPRQVGSSIKPISVYSTAIEEGKKAAESGSPMHFSAYDDKEKTELYGDYLTSVSGICNQPIKLNGKDWPQNANGQYSTAVSMRYAIEQSLNTAAVRLLRQIGENKVYDKLEDFGITSLVSEGNSNDRNASALALGGFVKGISPLEMTAAFSTFPNNGVRVEPISYTKVVDKNGKEILSKKTKEHKVLDPDVNYVMHQLLSSSVNNGIASPARASGKPTAGKTGTTTDTVDIWFCGYTPQYVSAIWIGNDISIPLQVLGNHAANVWGRVLAKATAGMGGSFKLDSSNVVTVDGDYFVKGTEQGIRFQYGNKTKEEEEKEKKEKEEKEKKEKEKEEQDQEQGQEQDQGENENAENPTPPQP
ncbi:MAG: transglycosylase domain-containing protein [Eubacteriales bacterium]|nr:transglycosylase domain-containing protein [Eubacteriales bacterium]MDY3332613.1 transglycosylase domain-containing protein [Gallibacter sp.]